MPRERATSLVVAFDLDDTLILEEDYVRSGFRAVDAWFRETTGVTGFFRKAWQLHLAGVRGEVFDRTLAELRQPIDPDMVARLVRVYREHEPDIALLPDARACLDALQAEGTPVALITDGPKVAQEQKVRALRLDERVDVVVISDELGDGRAKPHAAPFLAVSRAFEGGSHRFAYVGDNPAKDFGTPRTLGWLTVRVRRPRGQYARLEARPGDRPHVEVADLSHLCRTIRSLEANASLGCP